MTQIKNIFRV